MRRSLTRERLHELMQELAASAPDRRSYHVYLVGGGAAVHEGWRSSTINADLYSDDDRVFRDIQGVKQRLDVNIELVRPEDFVPALSGSAARHVFLETMGKVSFYHYDPYAQLLSKVVRGFDRDLRDAESFLASGMVDPERFRSLVRGIPDRSYARYPALTKEAVLQAVDEFLSRRQG